MPDLEDLNAEELVDVILRHALEQYPQMGFMDTEFLKARIREVMLSMILDHTPVPPSWQGKVN